MPTISLLIKGKVQGVYYRASAAEEARRLGCTGWVKNRPDGSVEALAAGSQQNLDAFVAWCKKGPARAVVSEVLVNAVADVALEGFLIVR